MARLRSDFWVAAHLRRCAVEGVSAVQRRRGAPEAGAIFVKVDRLDGTADLFAPAPQSAFEDASPADRAFIQSMAGKPAADVEAYLVREIRFDPDVWIVEVEDREGRHFLHTVTA